MRVDDGCRKVVWCRNCIYSEDTGDYQDTYYCNNNYNNRQYLRHSMDYCSRGAENENLTFTREELVKWLWKIVHNNSDNDFGKWCEELIDRLDGFERFVVETREWGEE